MSTRDEFHHRIAESIRARGWHQYAIAAGPCPPWTYTIGLTESSGGAELVFAGGLYFPAEDRDAAVARAARMTLDGHQFKAGETYDIEPIGRVRADCVDLSWSSRLLLGAHDRYGDKDFSAIQLSPIGRQRTIDVPWLSRPYDPHKELPWSWLDRTWDEPLPESTVVLTDLYALNGVPVTMVVHDETPPEWEFWATQETDIPEDVQRTAPLGTFIALDGTLRQTLSLSAGGYAARDAQEDEWRFNMPEAR